jgi:ABC-type dipeptide/oligopeptide/nickel transport system permease component
MVQFLVKRLIGLLFVVLGVTFITFIMGYLAPGDPIYGMLGVHYTPEAYRTLKHAYGLDLPWHQQYLHYLHNLFTLNFGLSYVYKNQDVSSILARGMPVSLELGLWALLLQLLMGIPLGIISALRANTWVDTTSMGGMLVLYAMPVFVIATLAQVIIVQLDQNTGINWPATNWGTPWVYSWDDIQLKLVPILIYATTGMAYFARLARTTMLEVLRQDFVRTARAKGLRERAVIYRHALRNALLPLVTVLGVSIGFLVSGAFFIENIFNIPGIARITLDSISSRDYPVIQATTAVLAVAVVLGNLLSDVLYSVVDPRIKIE